MSHPATTPEIDDDAPRLATEYVYLFIALLAALASVALWVIDVVTPGAPDILLNGIYDALRACAVVASCGYLVRSAQTRVARKVEHRSGECRECQHRYAAGFVAGVAAREGSHQEATVRSLH